MKSKVYYIEILHKAGTGNDNLAVGWTKPGDPVSATAPFEIIPASAIRPLADLSVPLYRFSVNGGPYQTSPNFTGLAAGTYTVTVQDSYGCGATSNSVTITQPSDFSSGALVNGLATASVCESTPINLVGNAIAGATYSWTGSNAFTSSIRNPTISNAIMANNGTYTLITTVGGCSKTNTVTVEMLAKPGKALLVLLAAA